MAGGVVLACLNYFISKRAVKRNNMTLFGVLSVLRSLINIIYLVVLYVIGVRENLDLRFLLFGGAFGITLPLIFLTPRLLRKDDPNKKEGDRHG